MVQSIRNCGCPSFVRGIATSCTQRISALAQRVWNAIASVFKCFLPCFFKKGAAPAQLPAAKVTVAPLPTAKAAAAPLPAQAAPEVGLDTSKLEEVAAAAEIHYSGIYTTLEHLRDVGNNPLSKEDRFSQNCAAGLRAYREHGIPLSGIDGILERYGLEQISTSLKEEGSAKEIVANLESARKDNGLASIGALVCKANQDHPKMYGIFIHKQKKVPPYWFFNPNAGGTGGMLYCKKAAHLYSLLNLRHMRGGVADGDLSYEMVAFIQKKS